SMPVEGGGIVGLSHSDGPQPPSPTSKSRRAPATTTRTPPRQEFRISNHLLGARRDRERPAPLPVPTTCAAKGKRDERSRSREGACPRLTSLAWLPTLSRGWLVRSVC